MTHGVKKFVCQKITWPSQKISVVNQDHPVSLSGQISNSSWAVQSLSRGSTCPSRPSRLASPAHLAAALPRTVVATVCTCIISKALSRALLPAAQLQSSPRRSSEASRAEVETASTFIISEPALPTRIASHAPGVCVHVLGSQSHSALDNCSLPRMESKVSDPSPTPHHNSPPSFQAYGAPTLAHAAQPP